MSDRLQSDVTPSERTAIVTLALARGAALAPHDIMRLTECAERTAYDVMNRLARILPVYEDEKGRLVLMDEANVHIY